MAIYVCKNCDSQFPKWQGKCPECGKWGTIEKATTTNPKGKSKNKKKIIKTIDINKNSSLKSTKTTTGIEEFDRVLGGGFVAGSLILFSGNPGIGKSTLLSQLVGNVDSTLYISGEESVEQVTKRIKRVNKDIPSVKFLSDTDVDTIVSAIKEYNPDVAVIDSIQTLKVEEGVGTIKTIKKSIAKIKEINNDTAIFLIGHVTKSGDLAGPKSLEHLVDVVLFLEGDRNHQFRFLKSFKNRFGSTNELGVFQMKDNGLNQVKNPSQVFLREQEKDTSGSVVGSILKGRRSLFLEVQALVTSTSFKHPKRRVSGFTKRRLSMLLGVLTKKFGLPLGKKDIHVNIVGGLKVDEPAADLPVAVSIISAFKNKPIDPKTVIFGEIGLAGELRSVSNPEKRILEAERIGFKEIVCPPFDQTRDFKIKVNKAKNLKQALKYLK